MHAMGVLGTWCAASTDQAASYAARAAQHHATFISVFNAIDSSGNTNRGGEIVRMFSGQYTYPGGTQAPIVAYCNANGIPIDVMAVADYRDYLDQGFPSPCGSLLAAKTASGWPTSAAYGDTMPATRAMYLEYYRHCLKYSSAFNGPTGYFALNQAVLASYTAPSGHGQQPGYIPLLVGYEGGLEDLVSGNANNGSDPLGFAVSTQITHDLYYDPAMFDVEQAHYQSAQQGGMEHIPIYNLAGPFIGGNSSPAAVWASAIWSGQPAGKGDGSTATNGLGVTNAFWSGTQKAQHLANASVRVAGYRDWQDSINSSSPSSINSFGGSSVRQVANRALSWLAFNRLYD